MASFENLHPSKAWAFTDGLLCGIFIAGSYFTYRLAIKSDNHERDLRRLREEIRAESFESASAKALNVVSDRTPWSTDK